MPTTTSIRIGGVALIGGALAFMGVFSYLAANFNYPEVLDGPASTVLPALLATGTAGRTAWAIYAFLPLIWLPAGVGAYHALHRSHPGAVWLALQFAVLSAISMMLGLIRWPTIHWRLAEAYAAADASQRAIISALFDGLNTYLGTYIGEFLGELSFSIFFLICGWALLRSRSAPKWVGSLGMFTGLCGLAGMFRNITPNVDGIAAINNYLLPLWMIVFGVFLVRFRNDNA